MTVCLITIGSEILSGKIINTNAVFLAKQLKELGLCVTKQLAIEDSHKAIVKALQQAIQESDVVITTGGLGPTCDDVTKKAFMEVFCCEAKLQTSWLQILKKRYPSLERLEEQAILPSKAKLIENDLGTAPGMYFQKEKKMIFALPGVPHEMRHLFSQIQQLLSERFTLSKKETKNYFFAMLAEAKIDVFLQKQSLQGFNIGLYPSLGSVQLQVESDSKKALDALEKKLYATFSCVYSTRSASLSEAILALLLEQKATLSIAESCTGGGIAEKFTETPGSSKGFSCSFVCYSNASKEKFLQVSSKTLQTFGAVSSQTAQEMMQGIFRNTEATYAISTTGIAGPSGGTKEKPVGTIYFCIGKRDAFSWVFRLKGKNDRAYNRLLTVNFSLAALWYAVTGKEKPHSLLFHEE